MKYCKICKKIQNPANGSFFRISNEDRKVKWSKICGMDFRRHDVVCRDHFSLSHIVKTGQKVMLLPNAVPIMPECSPAVLLPAFLDTENQTESNDVFKPMETHEVYMPAQKIHPLICSSDPVEKCFDEKQTQTDPVILDYTLERQHYLKKVHILETKIKELEYNLSKANAAVEAMHSIFTEGQIRKIMHPGNINWKRPDISNAICLHASGPRAYNHLYKKGFPLLHVSTLQRWCRKINLSEGILKTAIDFMAQISELEPEEKICVLAFDEMKVMETFEYD